MQKGPDSGNAKGTSWWQCKRDQLVEMQTGPVGGLAKGPVGGNVKGTRWWPSKKDQLVA